MTQPEAASEVSGEADASPDLPPASLRVTGVAFAVLFLAGAVLPRHPELDALFGLEAYQGRLDLYGVATVVLLALLFVSGAATALARAFGRATHWIPHPTVLVALAAGAAFLLVTNHRLSGDGTTFIWITASGRVYPSNALTCYLHQAADALPRVSTRDAVRLVDAAAGVVYVLAALRIARECFGEDRVRRATLAVLLLSAGAVSLFFGSIEVYAPLCAGIAVYLLAGIRHLRGSGRGWLPPLVLGVTFMLHGSAGLLLPSLLWLANDGRIRPFRVKRWCLWAVLFLLPVLVVLGALLFASWGGEPPTEDHWRVGSFLGPMGQAPILPLVRTEANLTHRYAMLDLEHLLGVVNLWILAAPAGLALLWLGRRSLARAPFARWVASTAAPLAAFPVFWNVSYALRRDWDLFSPVGIPLALLGGLAFLAGRRRAGTAVAVGVLSLYAFVPFVVANTGTRKDRHRYANAVADAYRVAEDLTEGESREEARWHRTRWQERAAALDRTSDLLRTAQRLQEEGRVREAEEGFRRVLDIDPERTDALGGLGQLLWSTMRREEGRRRLEDAVRSHPGCFVARYYLAWTFFDEGRNEEALVHLHRTVRYATIDDRILDVLDELEEYWIRKGDRDRADLMRSLAEERRSLQR
jgi:tetratricopeptide (TPR) repeat protein